MYEMMDRHLKICADISRYRPRDWEMTKRNGENELLAFFREVKELGLETQITQLSEQEADKLVADCGFCQVIQWFLEDGVAFNRIRGFLRYFPGKDLCSCDYASLKEALKDPDIPDEYIYDYWAYYRDFHLNNEQKKSLVSGISYLRQKSDCILSDIADARKKILWEPCFCQEMYDGKVEIPGILERLEDTALVKLLNYLYGWTGGCAGIGEREFAQMAAGAPEIRGYLEQMEDKIAPEDRGFFIANWLENGSLLFDLKKLARIMDSMDEKQIKDMAENRVAYISSIYGASLAGIELGRLDYRKESLLIYAVTRRKRHFLSVVRSNPALFFSIPWYSVLFDPAFYDRVNINALNEPDLVECMKYKSASLPGRDIPSREYTFEEMKCLFNQERKYQILYGCLEYPRVDDRLRVFREITKQQCLSENYSEEELKVLGKCLSQKSLARWMHEDFARISDLNPGDCVTLLVHAETLRPFLQDIRYVYQIHQLLRNGAELSHFQNLREFEENLCSSDTVWLGLKQEFGISDEFVEENKGRIMQFLHQDGPGIISAFCNRNESCKESARRLVIAELMGRFHELKYHSDDLSKEIDFPVSSEQKLTWMGNESYSDGHGFRIWEEDGLLPVIQIGEIPTNTCLSYRSGGEKCCLLSCFDTNKKVIFASKGTKVLFRAILRLTKGMPGSHRDAVRDEDRTEIEFLDLSAGVKQEKDVQGKGERMILFLERPYYRSLSPKEEKYMMKKTVELAHRKAKKLGAELVVSRDYNMLCDGQSGYFVGKYSIYISKSKNGMQYLDSLGGPASVADSGSYRFGTFITRTEEPGTEVEEAVT